MGEILMKGNGMKEKDGMRCYHFGNMYMSSIQQGIQAAHCQMELFLKYDRSKLDDNYPSYQSKQRKNVTMVYTWAESYKTMICLNAGYDSSLKEIKKLFKKKSNKYPWAYFKESKEAMNGMLTNVAIVLPKRIYRTAEKIRNGELTLKEIDRDLWYAYNEDELMRHTPGANPKVILTEFEAKLINTLNSCGLAK